MTDPLAMTPGVTLAEVTRRDVRTGHEVVESVHGGHLVVTDGDGDVLVALGSPEQVTYVRSAAKPFQTAACLDSLGTESKQITPAEIAVSWSSHRGEQRHLDVVMRLLERSNTAPQDLTCTPRSGQDTPGAAPHPLRADCSGKHAMFALVAARLGVPRSELLDVDGPVQRLVLDGVANAIGPPAAIGIDGCGAPAVAAPLASLARGYARLAVEDRYEAVRSAGLAHPGLVGGVGRLESALLNAGVVAKVGAEGVYGAGWVTRDGEPRGAAIKAADGSIRGVGAALVHLLYTLGVVADDVWEPPQPSGGGVPQGTVRPVAAVTDLARSLAAGS